MSGLRLSRPSRVRSVRKANFPRGKRPSERLTLLRGYATIQQSDYIYPNRFGGARERSERRVNATYKETIRRLASESPFDIDTELEVKG